MVKRLTQSEQGATLIEVMIALVIFSVFIAAYVASQGNILVKSTRMRTDAVLHDLAKQKMNEILLDPPDLRESLTLTTETKKFEDYPEYQYEIRWMRFKVPDLKKIQGSADQQESRNAQEEVQKRLQETVKKNLEELIWQVELTVKNTDSNLAYTVSSWLLNQKAKVNIDQF